MRALVAVCALIALTLGTCVSVGARSDVLRTESRGKRTEDQRVKAGWRLGEPVKFRNLTVFPVLADNSAALTGFISLDEGLRTRKVSITEFGRRSRHRRFQSGQSSDEAEVNKLALTNTSGKMLILIAGELLAGGKQDRIVAHDCILASSPKPQALDVFCVEHGRWNEEAEFGRSHTINRGFNASGGAGGTGSGIGHGVGSSMGGGSGAGSVSLNMAAPNVRAKAEANKSQTDVWNSVHEVVANNSVETSTGTLARAYDDDRVAANVASYAKAFLPALAGKHVVGAVAAVDGVVVSADVFANPELFQAYRAKLIDSYVLEAISSLDGAKQDVDVHAAKAFLLHADGNRTATHVAGAYRLIEHQADQEASFELESRRAAVVHFNRVRNR